MRTSTYTAWDRALNGDLTAILVAYKAEGLSLEDIAYRLRSDHDIKVSTSTVARWSTIAAREAAADGVAS